MHIQSFGDGPSLWLEGSQSIAIWMSGAKRHAELNDLRSAITTSANKARAHAEEPERVKALAGDEAAMAVVLAKTPGDQEVAVAIAQGLRSKGDPAAALKTLQASAKTGRMTPQTKRILASVYSDVGKLNKSDTLLTGWLAKRLPRYQVARKAYATRYEMVRKTTIESAESGNLPPHMHEKLSGLSQEKQLAYFGEYLNQRLENDRQLAGDRSRALRRRQRLPHLGHGQASAGQCSQRR